MVSFQLPCLRWHAHTHAHMQRLLWRLRWIRNRHPRLRGHWLYSQLGFVGVEWVHYHVRVGEKHGHTQVLWKLWLLQWTQHHFHTMLIR